WTVGEFMYVLFRTHDEHGEPVRRSEQHGTVVGRFLRGTTKHAPVEIVEFWLRDPSGRPKQGDNELALMYSPSVPYLRIKHSRPALTSMCVQLCLKHLLSERKKAEILAGHQPVALHIMTQLATPTPYRDQHGVHVVRKTRPPAIVATEILSCLNFSHTKAARLLPASRSVLLFACGVPRVIFDYSSRIGMAQSWHATYTLLARLAQQEAAEVCVLGRAQERWPIMRFDNVQHYHKQRETRIGRENAMKIGVAAYVAEALEFDPAAADLDDRRQRIAENKRKELTLEQLTEMIDFAHLETSMTLQWLQVLVNYVPALAPYKPAVAALVRTDGTKMAAPCSIKKTPIHPLKTVAKNEAVTTELRDAVADFLEQIGQQEKDFTRRLVPIGGDGLTFEKLVQLKNYLQFHEGEFERLDVVMPFLEIWHTIWTYLSTVFETHFGTPLTSDPSILGHSTAKVNQTPPPNLKKVDYYPGLYQVCLVLDARMLDCWRLHYGADDLFRHFEALGERKQLPTLETLRSAAQTLHERYSSQRAWYDAMEGGEAAEQAGWPVGSPWETGLVVEPVTGATQPCRADSDEPSAPPVDPTSLPEPPPSSADSAAPSSALFCGDRALAQSILFLMDAMLVRDISQAVAAGDVGRVWNDMKIMLFKFAGSDHTKYCTYLLEMVCSLELEASPVLREVFLKNWLVNPSGEPERTLEGDLLEEHMNLELEETVARKGAEWDSPFIREVVSPNVYHFVELRNEWGTGVGLARRRGRHPEPHSRPEIRTLLELYKDVELHLFRATHAHDSSSTTNLFEHGVQS
ncbi:hypothetical protein OH77DRAFT_1377558, partial [Trametes cingulata]